MARGPDDKQTFNVLKRIIENLTRETPRGTGTRALRNRNTIGATVGIGRLVSSEASGAGIVPPFTIQSRDYYVLNAVDSSGDTFVQRVYTIIRYRDANDLDFDWDTGHRVPDGATTGTETLTT